VRLLNNVGIGSLLFHLDEFITGGVESQYRYVDVSVKDDVPAQVLNRGRIGGNARCPV